MKRMLAFCLIVAALAFSCSEANAKPWLIDYPHSHLGFTGRQGDATFEGSFGTFKADIDFDPSHPENGKISATIDIASAKTGDGQKDSMLPQSDWFNTSKFPQAQFVSTKIRAIGTGSYEAEGTLTIKGVSKTIALPFTLTQEGSHWRARSKITLVRSDFRIGEGQWADNKTVKLAVDVMIDLQARPQS